MSSLPRGAPLALAILMALPATGLARPSPWFDEPEAEAAATPVYQDRIIAAEDLAPLPPDEDEAYEAAGLPRSWRLELVGSRVEIGDQSSTETGLGFGGLWDTERWGNWSLDGRLIDSDGRGNQDGLSGIATLWQRNLRFDGGWRADNGLGVLNTPLVPLQRDQYRFFLPSVPFLGASTDWLRGGDDRLQLTASLGRAGVFTGSRVVSFDQAEGDVAALGAQWQWAPGWSGAASLLATDGRIVPDQLGGGQFQDGRTEAALVTTRWDGARDHAQLNVQASSGYLGDATGAWFDGESRRGRYTWNYGLFRLEEGLAWGALPINNDAQGVYGRLRYQHARWNWSASLDSIESVSGDSFEGHYASFYARYQARANLGMGGNVNVRESSGRTDLSSRWFVDRRNRWGLGRLQLDQARTDGGEREDWLLSVDQELPTRRDTRLSLSATAGTQDRDGIGRTSSWSLAALGGIELGDRVSLDGNVRWIHGSGPEAYRGTDINLSLNWRMATHWWLQATVFRNRSEQRSPFIIDPLAPPDAFLPMPRERSVFLTLRYERQAGTPVQVLGAAPGAASGAVSGSVFLDDNGDGVRSANELPAANVTVLLDGRYSVRTDSEGRFSFPRVATGQHSIEVIPDNLPLPWFLDGNDSRRQVEVRVRDTRTIDIGARRER